MTAAEYIATVGLEPSDVYGITIETADNTGQVPTAVAVIYRDSPDRAEARRRYGETHVERTPDRPVAGLLEQERLDERQTGVIPARQAELHKRISDIL